MCCKLVAFAWEKDPFLRFAFVLFIHVNAESNSLAWKYTLYMFRNTIVWSSAVHGSVVQSFTHGEWSKKGVACSMGAVAY